LNVFVRFEKNAEISNFMKILPLGAAFFRANKHEKLRVAICSFSNEPDKEDARL